MVGKMLNKNYFLKGMKKLNTAFPRHQLTKEQIELYYERLQEFSNDEFKFAVEKLIDTSEFMPTVAGIKKQVEELKVSNDEKAREFESKLFLYDTDTTIRLFEKTGDANAVRIVKNNYKSMREAKISETGMLKAQMREQYKALCERTRKNKEITNNNLLISQSTTEEVGKIGIRLTD